MEIIQTLVKNGVSVDHQDEVVRLRDAFEILAAWNLVIMTCQMLHRIASVSDFDVLENGVTIEFFTSLSS